MVEIRVSQINGHFLETGRTYDPARKLNIPKRVTIGKLVDPEDCTVMYPNENYAKRHPPRGPRGAGGRG